MYQGRCLREDEEEIIERDVECGQGDWDDLIAIFDDNFMLTPGRSRGII